MDKHEMTNGDKQHDDEHEKKESGKYIYSFSFWRRIQTSQTVKVVMIGVLILLLQIPIVKIAFVIQERQVRSRQAADEIATKWAAKKNAAPGIIIIAFGEIK